MPNNENPVLSAQASIRGISELYIIVLGIGITEALVRIPVAKCEWTFISYIVLLFGFLSTVFRFSLEIMIFLEYISAKELNQWSYYHLFMVIFALLSALSFYLMGHNMAFISEFMFYTVTLLTFDLLLLIFSHHPWDKNRTLKGLTQKSLGVLSDYILFPKLNPMKNPDMSDQKKLVKRTHYHWMRSNLLLIIILIIFLNVWHDTGEVQGCPFNVDITLKTTWVWLQKMPQRIWLHQTIVGCLLLIFTVRDISHNYDYFFGRRKSAKAED